MRNINKEDINKIKNAINDTKGKIMLYDGKVIKSYYFAMSNGYTEDVKLVFSENREYLESVESIYDKKVKNFEVKKEFTKEEICSSLKIDCKELLFDNIIRSNTNRVNYITVNNIEYKGTEFRKLLGLRSTDFTIKELNNKIIITTKGYGHGVGMSQYGANGMANDGYNYEEILKYFFKNIEISSI